MAFEQQWIRFPESGGPLEYALVPWDTETFGFPVIELRLPAELPAQLNPLLTLFLDRVSVARPHLIVCKAPLEMAAVTGSVLAGHEFYPVEALVELHRSLLRFQPLVARVPATLRLRRAEPPEEFAIQEMARSSFQADRFHCDPHIAQDRAGHRFADWIQRAFRCRDPVFVFEDLSGHQLLGFYHVREFTTPEKKVDLSLAAIARAHQKSGLGLLMYQQVLLNYQAQGFALAETRVTVGNVDVLNLFTRMGFAIRNPTVTFHRYVAAD